MSWTDVLTTHEFWAGVPSGAVIGLAAPVIAARRSRNSDRFKADHEVKMHALKSQQEDLKSNRQLIRETARRSARSVRRSLRRRLTPRESSTR